MPVISDELVPLQANFAQASSPQEDPSFVQDLKAAGVTYNWPYRMWRMWSDRLDVQSADPAYNPFEDIKGTKFEADPMRFAYARDRNETRAIMAETEQDQAARDTLSRSGWSGTVASVGMGLLDPTIFLPVAKVFTGAAAGVTALRMAGDVAIAGAVGSAISESALAATTPGYTAGEFVRNVGTDTLLSGLLGAGAGALLSRAERAGIVSSLEVDRGEMGAAMGSSGAGAQSVGAAASDTRSLQMRSVPGLSALPDPTAKVSPPRRVLSSGFLSARRAVADLVETPYIFEENLAGIATTQGPALDRAAKLETYKARVGLAQQLDTLFSDYRFGEPHRNAFQRVVTSVGDTVTGAPEGKLTFPEFKSAIDEALRNGDQHPIPQVAEAAGYLRANILEPWKERAIKAGLLPEGIDAKTADTYMMRVWNKEKLIADRPRVVSTFADWLGQQEAQKESLRQSIDYHASLLSTHEQSVTKLTEKLAKTQADLKTVETQLGEARRPVQQALVKAEELRGQKAGSNPAAAAKAQGGASFETVARNRSNDLFDRRSGLQAKAADYERRIADATAAQERHRASIEELVQKWDGKSSTEAKAALKARGKAEADRAAKGDAAKTGRMTAADSAVMDAVKTILARGPAKTEADLKSLANEIVDRLVGSPDGRLPYDAHSQGGSAGIGSQARGPLAARAFMIPDNMVRDYLETDVQHVADLYVNTIVPDVLLTERFGDVDMTEAFRKINEEAAAKQMAAGSEKERLAIQKERDNVIADLAAMRDRIRHTYGFSSDPRMRFAGRMTATAARFDLITNLGGAALASLGDLAGTQLRYGLTATFRHAYAPFFKAIASPETRKALKAQREQLRTLGIAAETYLSTRTHGLYDVLDVYRPTSRFERSMNFVADKFGLANMLSPWTDFAKYAAGLVSSGEITRAVEAVANGKAKPRQIRDLAESGIDSLMAERIWRSMTADGGSDVIDGVRIANSGAWADEAARNAFEGMLARDVDMMVLTPGAEKPLMMSNPIAALILQYKTFVTAANERILVRSLQARDAQALQGLVSAVGLGMLAELAGSVTNGREPPGTAQDWVKAGMLKSGVLGWYQEGNSVLAKWTGGATDAFRLMGAARPDSRYISRTPISALTGPVAEKFETMVRTMSKLSAKALGVDTPWTAHDTRQLRRLVPGQNLFYIRRLLDGFEAAGNEAMGVPALPAR